MKRLLNWLALLTLVGWTGFLGQLLWWWYVPVNVVDYYNLPAKVLNPEKKVKRGQYLEFELEFEKFLDIPGKISRSLVNDRVVALTCETGATHCMGRHKTKVRVFIPLNVWPARYYLRTVVTYQVNPLQTAQEGYVTEWFEVTD